MPKPNDARLEAAGILSANKLRQLEEAGFVVVRRDEWERLKEIEEGLRAMVKRMGKELAGAAINSIVRYGKLYKELAKK